MSTGHWIQTSIELIAIVALIVGFIFEDRIIDSKAERYVRALFAVSCRECRRIVVGNYRHWRRAQNQKSR